MISSYLKHWEDSKFINMPDAVEATIFTVYSFLNDYLVYGSDSKKLPRTKKGRERAPYK